MARKKKLTDEQYTNKIIKIIEEIDPISAFIKINFFKEKYSLTKKQNESYLNVSKIISKKFTEIMG